MRVAISLFASCMVCVSSALAQEFPTRRAGLWEVTISHDGQNQPSQTMQQCTDAETDKLMNAFGGDISADLCAKQEIRKVGATFVINAICQVGSMKSTSQSVVSGDFNSSYTVKVTSKIEGLPKGVPAMAGTTTIQARWVGACKADQKPGDIIMAGGKRMNVRELRKLMQGVGK
ncbi:MAG: DUF3617 family protein [Hyphomicrobiales bacterium]|nr:DUF3617 family protein [Hyphomicrobiales bacterium]